MSAAEPRIHAVIGGVRHEYEAGRWVPPAEDVPPTAPTREITLREKLQHLGQALTLWQKAGRPMASRQLRRARQEACNRCELWRPAGNFWLGECTAPGCGCTKAKAALQTSKCTHPNGPRWPA